MPALQRPGTNQRQIPTTLLAGRQTKGPGSTKIEAGPPRQKTPGRKRRAYAEASEGMAFLFVTIRGARK